MKSLVVLLILLAGCGILPTTPPTSMGTVYVAEPTDGAQWLNQSLVTPPNTGAVYAVESPREMGLNQPLMLPQASCCYPMPDYHQHRWISPEWWYGGLYGGQGSFLYFQWR